MRPAGRSLAHHLAATARRQPAALALSAGDRRWTFAELLAEAGALGATLGGTAVPLIVAGDSLDLARHAYACSLENRPFWPVDRNRSVHWTGELGDEIDHLQRICAALPAGVGLRLDANAAWDEADARRFLAACRPLPIEGIEEPLRAPEAATLSRLQAMVPFPLAIDESLHLIDRDFWQAAAGCGCRRLRVSVSRISGAADPFPAVHEDN